MGKKIYVLTQGLYEAEIITASPDRSKIERCFNAIRKRNSTDAIDLKIEEVDEYDDSYLNNMPEDPIYKLRYKTSVNRFATAGDMYPAQPYFYLPGEETVIIKQLGYLAEEHYIRTYGECKCIQLVPDYIEVYVRCKPDEVIEKATKMITEYLESKNIANVTEVSQTFDTIDPEAMKNVVAEAKKEDI